MKRYHIVCSLLLLSAVITGRVSAQVALTGTNYTQSFDAIGLGLPPGWTVRTNATTVFLGTEASFTTNNISWNNTTGQFANYASTQNNGTNLLGNESNAAQATFTNRSLGMRQSGSFGDPGAAFAFQMQNTLGLADFQLTIDLNMLSMQPRTNFWIIDYGLGSSPTSFTPVWTNADPGAFACMTRTINFGAALDNQAQNVWIRVVTLEATTGFGTRDTFGIDNFRLNYAATGIAVPIPLKVQLNGSDTVLSWSNAAFALQAAPQIFGTYTNVPGATSPYTNPAASGQRYFRLRAN